MAINQKNIPGNIGLGCRQLGALAFFQPPLGATKPSEHPHRFIFIRKSNGNVPQQFSLPSFSVEEKKKDKDKLAFEADLDKHELPFWLRALDGHHKNNMTILHGDLHGGQWRRSLFIFWLHGSL